jgi:hypothetical protein
MNLNNEENFLLCIDYAWDNIQALRTIERITSTITLKALNNIIISLYSYEQLVILSNISTIEKYSEDLSTDLKECILEFKPFKFKYEKYFNGSKKDLSLFETQEHLYKGLLTRLSNKLNSVGLELDYSALDLKYLYKIDDSEESTDLTRYFY